MKYKNCFDAVSDVMTVSFSNGLEENFQDISEFCSLVDDLSEGAWSEELAVTLVGHNSIVVSVKCVSITTSHQCDPLFKLMRSADGTKFSCADDGDVWVHFKLPREWVCSRGVEYD